MLLVATLALAGPIFTKVGPETDLDASGNWPRAFPAEGGWHVLRATTSDYWYVFLDDALVRDSSRDRQLTKAGNLRDHAIAQCPDGTYLHVATAGVTRADDSAYAYRYDADFNLVNQGVLAESDAVGSIADVPVVCGDQFVGAGWFVPSMNLPMRFVEISYGLEVTATHDFYDAPTAMGASMLEDGDTLNIVGVPGKTGVEILFDHYATDYTHGELIERDFLPPGELPFWAQASMRVGECLVVAHLTQREDEDWSTGEGGDLWLQAFDRDYRVLDQVQLSQNEPPVGGNQPGLALKGDTLLAMYSKELHNYGWLVTIDLEACSPDGDTGGDTAGETGGETGSGKDTSGPEETGTPKDGGCGCAASPEGGLLAALAGVALLRRRR